MLKMNSSKQKPAPKRSRSRLTKATLAVAVLCLVASGVSVSRWGALRARLGISPTSAPAQASPSPLTLSKEYVYAGDRLVAIEEPDSKKSECCLNRVGKSCRCFNDKLPKPQALAASPESQTQVSVAWASAGEGLRYEVERSTSINGPFTTISLDTATSITDGGLSPCVAYLYRARTVDEYGDYSDYSNVDLATTCAFSQDPLTPQSTVIRGLHLEELRLAIEAVRSMAGLPRPSWTDPVLAGRRIRAVHVEELRSGLDEALGRVNLPYPTPYTDATLSGSVVKAAHIQELRQRMK